MFNPFRRHSSTTSLENALTLFRESEELLKRQNDAYNVTYSKAGSLIIVAAIFIPLASSYLQKFDDSLAWFILFLIPLVLILRGVWMLVNVLKPVEISSGVNPDDYDAILDKSREDMLLHIIGTNRSCYVANRDSLSKLQKDFLCGIKCVFGGIALWLSLLFINAIFNQIVSIICSKIFDLI